MLTEWGERLDPRAPLPEYPRPQMVRESYLNLNGAWEYGITHTAEPPLVYDGSIVVPFSPESPLSGVNRILQPHQSLWYRRRFTFPDGFVRGSVLLHFGAVDQWATVFVNGRELAHHIGGYLPFTVDMTEVVREGENEIALLVRDYTDTSYHSRGKQKLAPGGIWYTPQSGIWQTVWLESVPETYIERLVLTPLYDEAALELTVVSNGTGACTAYVDERVIPFAAGEPVRIPMPGFIPWTPETPHLYPLTVEMGEDCVESYFAMRKCSVGRDAKGRPRLMLNNEPVFQTGVLDQGYWPDGLYTAPSDEALIADIARMKALGFNMLRKHIKIEPLRFYYHCDRLGMLVWQDMVNGGYIYKPLRVSAPLFTNLHLPDGKRWHVGFARADASGREEYRRELAETVTHLYNCPCIYLWTPFNEGWGQFDARDAVRRIRELDPTRMIDHASGWHDQGAGDVKSVHVYMKPYRFRPDVRSRAVVLSEFGGYSCRVEGHSARHKAFGYRTYATNEQLTAAYENLYQQEVLPAAGRGLSASVYTQLSDVEGEINGLYTYDRAVLKLDSARVRALNEALRGL